MRSQLTVSALLLAASAGAQAHPGEHGGPLLSVLAHIWGHPCHWLGAAALLAAGACLLRRRTPAARRAPQE